MYEKLIRKSGTNSYSFSLGFLDPRDYHELISLKSHQRCRKIKNQSIVMIPVSIFSSEISILESLVFYLKNNLMLSFPKIAQLLDRSYTTIYSTYQNVLKKNFTPKKESSICVPLFIFNDRNLSAFESVVFYLKNISRLSNKEIGILMNKDNKVIWKINDRASKKIKPSDFILRCEQPSNSDDQIYFITKKKICYKYNITEDKFDQILSSLKLDDIYIPIAIFREEMSPFSALVSYLKENAALSNAKIAELLNRSQSQVATVVTLRLEITDLSYSVPLHVFSDKNYSILEHTVHNLMNNHGLNLKQVSYLLNRSSSFIWKVHKRYEAKSE